MATRFQPFDIGCEASPSVPAETVLQNGWKTYLLFFAVTKDAGGSGRLRDLGVAVLDCQECATAKFGYPNDEGLAEHPLYGCGMAEETSSVLEVLESPWEREVSEQMLTSARRIWGGRGMEWGWARERTLRHFIIPLKEKTFECLATSLSVERFFDSFSEALSFALEKLAQH